jgi:hypothetical protein
MVDQIYMEAFAHSLWNDRFERIMVALTPDGSYESEPAEDTVGVSVNRKSLTVKRIRHYAAR